MQIHRRDVLAGTILSSFAGARAVRAAETTLRFYSWQTDDGSNSIWWKAANAAFEAAHPGVKIDFIKIPRASFADQLMVMFGAGNPPDIVHLAAFEFQAFADQGWLADLAPRIKADGPDLKGWAGQHQCDWQGKTVCINLNYFGVVLYYNDKLLKLGGVSLPHDWPSFLDAARKITAAGKGQFYGTGLDTVMDPGQYVTELLGFVLDAGGRWTNEQGKPTIDTPQVIEGLAHWKQLQTEGLTPMGDNADAIRQLFIEGRIGMRIDGPWVWGLLAKAGPDVRPDLKTAAPPFHPPVGGTSNVIAMPAGLEPARAALVWQYIQMITSAEWQEKYVALTGQLAPRPGSLTPAVLQQKPFLALFQQTQNEAAAAGIDRLPKGFETTYNQFAKIVTEEAQRMVINNLDPAATARRIQQRVVELQQS